MKYGVSLKFVTDLAKFPDHYRLEQSIEDEKRDTGNIICFNIWQPGPLDQGERIA